VKVLKAVKLKYKEFLQTSSVSLSGFLLLAVVHEWVRGFIARQYCSLVLHDWIPTQEYFMQTRYINCTNMDQLMLLQNIVEIVGYQLIAFYTALVSFYVFYDQKIQ